MSASAPGAASDADPIVVGHRVTPETVLGALRTQVRVIHALVLRETRTRYGEHKVGFLWAFAEPIAMIAIISTFFMAMHNDEISGMPLVAFMITGFVPFTIFRDIMQQMQGAIGQNKMLLAFPQVTTFDVILARGVLEFAVLMCVFGALLLGASLMGFEVRCENPLGVLAVCVLLAMMGTGWGFALASITPLVPSARQIVIVVLGRPLFYASGLFYTAEAVPSPVRDWLLYNPLLHLIELGRSAFFVEFESAYASWTYATLWTFGMLVFGLLVHQSLRKRATVGL